MHESEKVEAELEYVAKREESEDEWVVSRTISLPLSTPPLSPLSGLLPCRVGRRRWRRRTRVNLSGLSRCAIISFPSASVSPESAYRGRLSNAYLCWRCRKEIDVISGSSFKAGIRANRYDWMWSVNESRAALAQAYVRRRDTHALLKYAREAYLKNFCRTEGQGDRRGLSRCVRSKSKRCDPRFEDKVAKRVSRIQSVSLISWLLEISRTFSRCKDISKDKIGSFSKR